MASSAPDFGRGVVVEIVGVAGAGKSTLVSGLTSADRGTVEADFIFLRQPGQWIDGIAAAVKVLPLLAGGSAGRLPWPESKLLLYLTRWHERLRRSADRSGSTLIVDQGPVYGLARLDTSSHATVGTERYRSWRSTVAARWQQSLDLVVVLDAPNAVLAERVMARRQDHVIKRASVPDQNAFFDAWRASQERAVTDIAASSGPMVVRFDSGSFTPAELVAAVADQIRSVRSGRRR